MLTGAISLSILFVAVFSLAVAAILWLRSPASEPLAADGTDNGYTASDDPEQVAGGDLREEAPQSQEVPQREISAQPETTFAVPNPGRTSADTPAQALKLSEEQASAQLREMRSNSLARLAGLKYSWVPQVSSKCVGLSRVDIKGPEGFFPDGSAETRNPGNAEILAFHLAVSDRFDVVTLLWNDISPRTPSYPVCEDPWMMWHAFATEPFDAADEANQWCDDQGFPVDECFARYLVAPGQSGTKYKLR